MGLPSIDNFDVSFIKRTSENLDKYKGEFEFTMLLNSLLGLIVAPNERRHRRNFTFDFWKMKLVDYKELRQIFSHKTVKLIKGNREIEQRKFFWLTGQDRECNINEVSVLQFIKRVRHSIAPFGIIPITRPDNKTEWDGLILQNYRKGGTLNFEICLMEDEMEILAKFISSKYLETYKMK